MRIIKFIIYSILYFSGILNFILFVYRKVGKEFPLVILLYHRIVDNNSQFLLKSGVVQHHISDFKREMAHLNKWYDVVSMDEAIRCIKNGANFKKPSVAITFDDGYRDNYALAYPVLKQYQFPAIIYLTTSLIGTYNRIWVDEIESALMQTKHSAFKLPSLFGDEELIINSTRQKRQLNIRIAQAMKKLEPEQKRNCLSELFHNLEVDRNSFLDQNRMMLNWAEIQEMQQQKISFGAHTHTHPVLTKIPVAEAKNEILKSKEIIEEKLAVPVRHFAFPNGRDIDFSNELKDFCIKVGFDSIATANYGAVDKSSDRFALNRFGAERPFFYFAIELARLFLSTNR